jgi:hypothetical protein
LQRIEYEDPKGYAQGALLPNIVKYLVLEHTHPKNIYSSLRGENRDVKFYFSLSVLAHLRDNKRLSHDDIAGLVKGTYLRKEAQDDVLEILVSLGLISSWQTKRGASLTKNLYPELLKVGK